MIATGVTELSPVTGTRAACVALAVSRATHYRRLAGPRHGPPAPRPRPARALSLTERTMVLELLHADRFVDVAPGAVVATLLDEGTYLASERTMYRILAGAHEVRERRDQLRHPAYARPELLATGPRELWSWDITKLRGPVKWTYFQLYVILDVFNRYVPGWMVATRESAELARRLIADTAAKQGIEPDSLTIHADRATSMTSRPVALLLADLGISKSHSRPHVSNDCIPRPASRRSSTARRRSSTARPSRPGSARSRTRGPSARTSSPGTTASIATAGSRCTPRPTSTTAARPSSEKSGPTSSTPPTRRTRSGSSRTVQASACPRRGLDQPTGEGGAASLIFDRGCLTGLDRFRFGSAESSQRDPRRHPGRDGRSVSEPRPTRPRSRAGG